MTLTDRIDAASGQYSLFVAGVLPVLDTDGLPSDYQSIVLLAPREPGFWDHVSAQPEFSDSAPDPVDRWSDRVIGELAHRFAAMPFLPFGGPPWHPFYSWALRSGRAFASPVSLLVHDQMGLFASYRGALAVTDVLPTKRAANPCDHCVDRPCLTACPVGAMDGSGYDLPRCHAYLDSTIGKTDCMKSGCGVRRSCPVSQSYGRLSRQSAYHMGQFHK